MCDSARFGTLGASTPVEDVDERGVLAMVADRLGKYPERWFGSMATSGSADTGVMGEKGVASLSSDDRSDEADEDDDTPPEASERSGAL